MTAKIRTSLLIAATAALSVFGTIWYHSVNDARKAAMRNYEEGPIASVLLMDGRAPLTADIQVFSQDGAPLAGRTVHVHNNSGGNIGTTDSRGSATVSLSEPEVDQISLDDKVILDRPRAVELSYPSVVSGLRIFIITK